MTRLLLHGGEVLDGTGAPAAPADVVVDTATGTILDVGPGLDGDDAVDCAGATVTPGFVDAHVHVTSSGVDLLSRVTTPFSYQFFAAARNLMGPAEPSVEGSVPVAAGGSALAGPER